MWVSEVYRQLEPYALELQLLASAPAFKVTYTFIYPEEQFYTTAGRISGRTTDLSNCEKNLQDCLFVVIGANDKLVTELHSYKRPGAEYAIEIEITALELSTESDACTTTATSA